jgi:serine/threonine protein kinase
MAEDDPRERAEQRTVLMPRREMDSELPRGTKLQEFVIDKVLGVGGYSIVYLATDTKLQRRVALKEFVPATLAQRAPDGNVVPRLPRFAEFYDKGLQSFINESRLLGSFDHASLVKVYRFWPENGTAYMVMPYYEGITLKRWLADLGTPPSERWLRKLASMLMEALSVMHAQNCYHRDVAPDNILMLYDRKAAQASGDGSSYLEQRPKPVLLDFGAARRVIGDATQNLTAILKSGYSPVEQYEGEVSLRQGAWTDVYALCAVLYTAAIGKAPASSVARIVRDELVPARIAGQGRYSDVFLHAVDAGLSVRPEARPQSMAALRELLNAAEAPPMPAPTSASSSASSHARPRAETAADVDLDLSGADAPRRPAWLLPAMAAGVLVLLAGVAAVLILKR